MIVEDEPAVEMKFAAYRSDCDAFYEIAEKNGFDDTEMFERLMNLWIGLYRREML